MWNKLLTRVLTKEIGCECTAVDESVLTCKRGSSVCHIYAYVDDIILATSVTAIEASQGPYETLT